MQISKANSLQDPPFHIFLNYMYLISHENEIIWSKYEREQRSGIDTIKYHP